MGRSVVEDAFPEKGKKKSASCDFNVVVFFFVYVWCGV